ncbi:hypothetical protein [Actinomadura sp. SCN-SB]|uniref:hypothetical protein n=1 Tax=Actinomadura sp. SCN-SB TaxID=3373092 RepID=UPI00375013EC
MEGAPQIISQSAIPNNVAEGPTASDPQPWRDAALALVSELEGRGLVAQAQGHGVVWARNPTCDPETGDQRGQSQSPHLQQEVLCRPLGGSLWWLWAWSGARRDSPVELEPLCPVSQVETAAERIAHVLAVPYGDGADDERP